MKVIKRDGRIVNYDGAKIVMAMKKANDEVSPHEQITTQKILDIERFISKSDRSPMKVE